MFKDSKLNQTVVNGIYLSIIGGLLKCIELMKRDFERKSEKIANNELEICNVLFCNYLDNDAVMESINFNNFRFSSEAPENYKNNIPQGRVDLKVYSFDSFHFRQRYFIIECKRIDGTKRLNCKYIDEGMRRFVGNEPKYISYDNKNFMLGFVVREIDIAENINKINTLLQEDNNIHVWEYLHKLSINRICISSHGENDAERITLYHLFPDCSSIIS